eukprot:364209-Chlamydomonas_euryale.AAC.10
MFRATRSSARTRRCMRAAAAGRARLLRARRLLSCTAVLAAATRCGWALPTAEAWARAPSARPTKPTPSWCGATPGAKCGSTWV